MPLLRSDRQIVHRNWEKGPEDSYPRELLVSRVHALVGKRLDAGVFEEDTVVVELLDKLGVMCMHEYSVVRKRRRRCCLLRSNASHALLLDSTPPCLRVFGMVHPRKAPSMEWSTHCKRARR